MSGAYKLFPRFGRGGEECVVSGFHQRRTKRKVAAESHYLEFAQVVDEQVLRLEVPVEDAARVAVGQAADQLEQEYLRKRNQNMI